jgi:hypothetical protein
MSMRLDDLVREGLTDGSDRVRFDAGRWVESVTDTSRLRGRVPLGRVPRPPRRWVAAVAVAAVLVVGMGVPLALLSGLGGGDRGVRPGGATVTGHGLSLELPGGWEGGVAGPRGSDYGPFLQAANRPLAPPESDPFATTTRRELAPDDVTLVLIEYTESLAERGREPGENGNFSVEELPIAIREGDFQPSFEGVSDLHDFARRTFTVNGRSFDLWVEFGQKPAAGDLVSVVNDILATFRAEPAEGTSGYKTQADIDDGLSIRIPEPWTFHQDPSGPDDPRTIFAVGSWTFTTGGDCAPVAAQEELPADGVLFWLIEYTNVADPSEFPVRPEHFELDESTYAQYECSLVPSYLIRFQDQDRYFQVHVALGPEASESLAPEVLRALESIEVGPSPTGYETYTDPGDGLSVTIPQEWSFSEEPTDPIEPENVLAAGSWAFPEGGVCAPFAALDELPPDGAFFWMIEYHGDQRHPEDFVPRPDRFDFADFRYGKGFSCYGVVPQYQLRFTDQGRFFQLQVAFGGQAPESRRAEVLRVLDSIEVTAPVPDECPADTGPWSDPDCPLPAWTRAVVEEAGYEVTGDTGSALIARAAGSGIYIWANEEEELSSEPAFTETLEAEGYERWGEVAGRTLFTDGIRAVWVVQDLRVWVAGGPVDDLPELEVVAPLVEASERVDYDAIDTG